MAFQSEALVARGPFSEGKWALEKVTLRPLREDEVLVELVASGICHTDIHCGNTAADAGVPGVYYPRVLGHEGSGYVVQVGSAVTKVAAGDAVLLSFSYCGDCHVCQAGTPSHCRRFYEINFLGEPVFAAPDADAAAAATIGGRFFGQSSFARHSVVSAKSVVNVSALGLSRADLRTLAPLGCGFQTGSGTVVHVAQAGPDDSIAVVGMGGVGLAAVMAARNRDCAVIVGIDRVEARLALARALGATHTINTTGLAMDAVEAQIRAATADGLGTTVAIDTSGHAPLVAALIGGTRFMGKIIQVGTGMPDAHLSLPMQSFMVSGKQYFGAVQGHVQPETYVPGMIQWWRDGRFPIEKLLTFYPVADFATALQAMGSSDVIKPVIVW